MRDEEYTKENRENETETQNVINNEWMEKSTWVMDRKK